MKRKRSFTTSLPVEILDKLEQIARETGRAKNDIIAEAVMLWDKKRRTVTPPIRMK